MAGGGGGATLEYTPTWIVAVVCSAIVLISLVAERLLHYLGKLLKRKNQKALFEALLKVKEELMLLGFISLLLVVFQGAIQKICIPPSWERHMLPCKREGKSSAVVTEHYASAFFSGVVGGGRRLLAGGGGESGSSHCSKKGKVPLLSLEAIHDLHIFIFALAVTHVILSVLTMLFGGLKIREWKPWEDSIQKNVSKDDGSNKITHLHQSEFIKDRYHGIGEESRIIAWLPEEDRSDQGEATLNEFWPLDDDVPTAARFQPQIWSWQH